MLGQTLVNGVAVGAIYALVALGFVLVYRSIALFNFAQAEFYTFGALIVFSLLSGRVPLALAAPVTIVAVALLGVVSERLAFRRLLLSDAPLVNVVVASIALGIILRSLALLIWGADAKPVPPVGEGSIVVADLSISAQHAFVLCVAVGAVGFIYWFLHSTRIGLALRATASNRRVAEMMGMHITTVLPVAFGLSSGLGALAGILVAPIFLAQFTMGQAVIVKAFAAAILGGLSSIPGVIVGGLVVGLAESLAGTYLSSAYKDVVAFAVLILVLAVRPQGLVGGTRVEKV